jgi:hypothetical protein
LGGATSFGVSIPIPRGSKIEKIDIRINHIAQMINNTSGEIVTAAISNLCLFSQNETFKIGYGYTNYNNFDASVPGVYMGQLASRNNYNGMNLITNSEGIDDNISFQYKGINVLREATYVPEITLNDGTDNFFNILYEYFPKAANLNEKRSLESVLDSERIDRTNPNDMLYFYVRDVSISVNGKLPNLSTRSIEEKPILPVHEEAPASENDANVIDSSDLLGGAIWNQ